MTKTVTIAATRTNGDPYAHHDVIVTLVAGSAGGVVGSNVIVEQSTVKLNASGQGSITLRTNDVEITSPSTSFYRFTVADSSPTITRAIRLTDALPSSVSWTLAGIQVGDPTIPQRDVSSDYVTIGGQSLTNYLADRADAAAVDLFLAVATTDGTNTSWDVLAPDAAAEADGLVPAGWASTVHLDMGGADFIAVAAPDADPDTVFTVLVPAGDAVGVWQFTPATIEAPWTQVDVSLAYCTAPKWFGAATDAGAWVTLADPDGAAAALAAEATAREDADSALTSDVAGKASAAALTAEADARAAGDASNALDLARTQRSIGATVVDQRPKLRLHTAVDGSGLEGGAYSTPQLGDLTGGFWLRFTATVEPYLTPPADPEDPPALYSEIITLPHDLVGSWDNLEPAFERMWDNDSGRWRTYLFCEWTEIGGTIEAQQVTTLRSYTTDGVVYPKREVPEGVDQEWAIWLDFANGDGVWEYKLLRRVYDGTPDETVDGAEWELFLHVLGDAPTSIDTGVTAYPWRIGCGPGKVRYGEIVFRNGGPDGADLFAPSGAEAVAAGEGQPFTDGTGVVWTPEGGEAEVYDPTATGGGVALGETSTTAYRGDRGKTAYDHSQVVTGNPHGTTAADVGAAAASHTHAASAIASGTIDIARIPTGTTGSTVPFGNDARFSDTRTPTDASVTTAKLDATLTAALARIPQTVQLGSDQSVTSQQTLQNITGLSFAVTAGSTYYIDGLLYVTGATAADLRVGFTCPAGTVKVAVYGMTNIATAVDGNVTGSAVIQASGGEVSTLGTITGTEQAVIVRGYFACTTNGTFQMQHAQRTSTGSATTVNAGSFITYHT